MRKFLSIAAAVVALTVVPAASAEVLNAEGQSLAGGVRFTWSIAYDTASNNLDFTCAMFNPTTGEPVAATAGTVADITVVLANGQERTLDCVPILNLGTQTSKVNLKVASSGRWSGFLLHGQFIPA